jgi:stringent starvation protein B
VPAHVVNEGRVVLNIAARAVAHLDMDNDAVAFTARFGGVSHAVVVPMDAVLAIYARETGQGMALPEEGSAAPAAAAAPDEAAQQDVRDGNGDDEPPPPRRGHLRIVK